MSEENTADLLALLDGMEQAFETTDLTGALEEDPEAEAPRPPLVAVPPPNRAPADGEEATETESEPSNDEQTVRASGSRLRRREGRPLEEALTDYRETPPPVQIPPAARGRTGEYMAGYPWIPEREG